MSPRFATGPPSRTHDGFTVMNSTISNGYKNFPTKFNQVISKEKKDHFLLLKVVFLTVNATEHQHLP
jgi:hypothetical protein